MRVSLVGKMQRDVKPSSKSFQVELKTFYRPAIIYTEDPIENISANQPNLGSYTELELQTLISRISVEVIRRVRGVSVHFDRTIVNDRVDNHLHVYLKSGGRIVIPDNESPSESDQSSQEIIQREILSSEIPTSGTSFSISEGTSSLGSGTSFSLSEEFILAEECVQIGAEPITLQWFQRLVDRCERKHRDWGVIIGHPIHTPSGIIPDWWIQSISQVINLDWLARQILLDSTYDYIPPTLMRIRHGVMIRMSADTPFLNLFNNIGGIVAKILIDLYNRGCLAYQADGTSLHPSGLYLMTWSHVLLFDRTKFLERVNSYGRGYTPLPGYLIGGIEDLKPHAIIKYDHRYLTSDGTQADTLRLLDSI